MSGPDVHYVKGNMPGKRDRCANCGKPMRRLYMQKNIATGSRGMVATGWFCEHCKFSDIISNFKESIEDISLHPSLTCKCEACGGVHKKNSDIVEDESVFMDDILKKLSGFVDSTFVPEKQIEGLIMINNTENASEYLGLVMGVFLCGSNEENQQIAKNVFKANANHIQKELIDSVWKKSWKRKGWEPLHSSRFKKKIEDSSIDINQILGMGIILKHRITESTFKTIDLLDTPEIYINAALKFNPHLTEEYAKRAINEKEKKTALKYLVMAIKGGKYDLLKNYADLKGKEATDFILEQLKNKSKNSHDEPFYEALSRTGDPEAALLLVKKFCEVQNYSDRNCLLKIGNANSDDPLIKALATLQDANSYFDVTEMITILIAEMDDYKPIEFLLQYYKEPKEMASLFKKVIESSGDYEVTKKFILDAKGINSRYYKEYLLTKDPDGVRKFIFNDDSALRLMGLSMAESLDLDIELEEYIFAMSFLDSEETIRDRASELIKEKGLEKLTNIFNSSGDLSFNLPYGIKALEKLIGFEDTRFLPIILNHSNLNDVEEKVIGLLKKLNPNNKQTIEMLFQIAIEKISGNSYRNEAPKNIIKIALDIDTKLSCSIISNMKIEPTVFENIMGLIFQMSFTHSIESTRKGATKLVKNVGVSKIKKIFDDDKATFNYWWASKNWNGNTPFPESRQLENLNRLIDYDDSRFIPLIMKHSHVNGFNDLEKPFLACLKRFNPNKNDLVEMLFKIALEDAPQDKAKNAVMIALNVDKHKSYDKIRKEMKIVTGKDRSERKLSVNRRLMFITIFRNMTTPDDIPYLRELMKKDRSPRVKKQLAQIIIEHT